MSAPRSIVLLGGGLAAAACCERLREAGYDGRLLVIGDEAHLPYERPPLSKGYLIGSQAFEKAFVHDAAWYSGNDVELHLGRPVRQLDLADHVVVADEAIRFDRLLLATGAAPRRLALADGSGGPVHYLRTVEDSDRLREVLVAGARIALLGAGWIGLEVAAAARDKGCEVVVVEPAEQPLLRVLGPEMGTVFADLHREHGVDLRTGVRPLAVSSGDGRAVLDLSDGTSVAADTLLVAVGASPRVELAEKAGLRVDNGVVVDEHLRSSHPDVWAAGDVANAYHPLLGRHLRVEHWDNAIQQGRTAAVNMLGGHESYARQPYFFSDQYDLGLEYVGGTPDGYDEVVVRGDVAARVFTAYWYKGARVVAGMHVNDWDAIDDVRGAVESGRLPG